MSTTFAIHPAARIGAVDLAVSDADRALDFYTNIIGFSLLRRRPGAAALAADGVTPLLRLYEVRGARPKPPRSTGLYHFAILTPARPHLARALMRLIEARYEIDGASDHHVSEALYLADPDGNGIEIYADRPREQWPFPDGRLAMVTAPLDLQDLLKTAGDGAGQNSSLPPQTRIGHIHLHVANLEAAVAFYQGAFGFDLMQYYGRSAAFLSAGGYHHHVGVNIWAGQDAPPPPADAAGLRAFTVLLPDQAEVERLAAHLRDSGVPLEARPDGLYLHDPSQNPIRLSSRDASEP